MVYFIFDLDETLAELYSVYYFVTSLRLESSLLALNLDKAYQYFVRDILLTEISNEPLGILRPGILGIMKKLKDFQKQGKIKNVLIYSNNGDIKSLEFIKDLIHLYVGGGLIKECIHRNHHMRADERVNGPQLINKTWNVLRNIMINGNTRASTNLVTSDVYFFDDIDHADLRKKLGINYYKVPRYDYKASVNRVAEIYKNAIYKANIKGAKLKKYVNIILKDYIINSSNTVRYDTNIERRKDLHKIKNGELAIHLNLNSFMYTYKIIWFNKRNCNIKKALSYIFEPSYRFKMKLYEQITAGKDFYEYVFDDFYRFKVSSVL